MLEVPSRSSGNTRAPHCNWAPSVLPVEVHVSSSASHSQSGLEFLEAILSKHPDQSINLTQFPSRLNQNYIWISLFNNLIVNSDHPFSKFFILYDNLNTSICIYLTYL